MSLTKVDERGAVPDSAYLADERLRAAAERWLQLAEQTCIDVGAHVVTELVAPPPADYAGIFTTVAATGQLDQDLAR